LSNFIDCENNCRLQPSQIQMEVTTASLVSSIESILIISSRPTLQLVLLEPQSGYIVLGSSTTSLSEREHVIELIFKFYWLKHARLKLRLVRLAAHAHAIEFNATDLLRQDEGEAIFVNFFNNC